MAWHQNDTPWEQDRWELYHTDRDFSQARDLAAEQPAKLRALQKLWAAEAKKYDVLPLDDRRYERTADPTRPVAARPQPVYTYYPGTSIVHPLAAPRLLVRKHTVTAYVKLPESGAEGVLAALGGELKDIRTAGQSSAVTGTLRLLVRPFLLGAACRKNGRTTLSIEPKLPRCGGCHAASEFASEPRHAASAL